MAASFIITIGTTGLIWKQTRHRDSIEEYLADHYSHDDASLVAQDVSTVDKSDVDRILAHLGASVNQKLAANILFSKFCHTPDGHGAHMVISTEQGLMTVIRMPYTDVTNGGY